MKKLAGLFALVMVAGMSAMPAFAQEAAAGKPPEHVATAIAVAAGLVHGHCRGVLRTRSGTRGGGCL